MIEFQIDEYRANLDVNKWITSTRGPVYRDMLARTLRIDARAKQLCPVDTGRLRSSIRWQIDGIGDGRTLTASISANTKYARFVHDGTRYMRARPFLLRALQETR